jgi:hypothetical protein
MQGGATTGIKLNKAMEHLPTVYSEQFKDFDIPQQQLYVLTGFKSEFNDRTIRVGEKGPHLRFVFSDKQDNYQLTILMLQFYQIKFCDDLHKADQNQYCITVDNTQFAKINALFSKDESSRRKIHKFLDYDLLKPQQRLWLMNLLCCTDTFTKLEERYLETLSKEGKYSFDSLMSFHKEYIKSSALCFEYLEEKKKMKENNDPPVLTKAFTPGLNLQPLSPFPAREVKKHPNKRVRLTLST